MTEIKASGSSRAVRTAVFGASGILLCIAVIAALGWFASPRGENVSLGLVESYPPGDQPYDVTNNDMHLFVINTGASILVLDASSTRPICFADVFWNPARERFEDPCHGAHYRLDGQWFEGPPARDLDRYPVRIEGDDLKVDLTRLIRGEESWSSR